MPFVVLCCLEPLFLGFAAVAKFVASLVRSRTARRSVLCDGDIIAACIGFTEIDASGARAIEGIHAANKRTPYITLTYS